MSQKTISLCIIGKPNVGKSVLLNKLIGQKLSIVTHKINTTRCIITGIVTIQDTQLIILDTPGIFIPNTPLDKLTIRRTWSSLRSVDIIVFIIDSTQHIDHFILQTLKKLQIFKKNIIILFNKIDIYSRYQQVMEDVINFQFTDIIMFKVSALTGENIDNVLHYVQNKAVLSSWLYDANDITNLSMRFLATEITREQLLLNLHQELPYNLVVNTEMWQENKNKSIKIHQIIIVLKDSYKMIILGKHGHRIKEIGLKARIEMQKMFNCKIHLFLFVKVDEFWIKNSRLYNN